MVDTGIGVTGERQWGTVGYFGGACAYPTTLNLYCKDGVYRFESTTGDGIVHSGTVDLLGCSPPHLLATGVVSFPPGPACAGTVTFEIALP